MESVSTVTHRQHHPMEEQLWNAKCFMRCAASLKRRTPYFNVMLVLRHELSAELFALPALETEVVGFGGGAGLWREELL